MFQKNITVTSSGLNGKPSEQETVESCPFCYSLGLLFDPAEGDSKLFRNVGKVPPDYIAEDSTLDSQGSENLSLTLFRFQSLFFC
jgi:hypothetical protein